MKKNKDAWPFKEPVDLKIYPNYLVMIKNKPMDLGTLQRNLNNDQYSTVEAFRADLKLIW